MLNILWYRLELRIGIYPNILRCIIQKYQSLLDSYPKGLNGIQYIQPSWKPIQDNYLIYLIYLWLEWPPLCLTNPIQVIYLLQHQKSELSLSPHYSMHISHNCLSTMFLFCICTTHSEYRKCCQCTAYTYWGHHLSTFDTLSRYIVQYSSRYPRFYWNCLSRLHICKGCSLDKVCN